MPAERELAARRCRRAPPGRPAAPCPGWGPAAAAPLEPGPEWVLLRLSRALGSPRPPAMWQREHCKQQEGWGAAGTGPVMGWEGPRGLPAGNGAGNGAGLTECKRRRRSCPRGAGRTRGGEQRSGATAPAPGARPAAARGRVQRGSLRGSGNRAPAAFPRGPSGPFPVQHGGDGGGQSAAQPRPRTAAKTAPEGGCAPGPRPPPPARSRAGPPSPIGPSAVPPEPVPSPERSTGGGGERGESPAARPPLPCPSPAAGSTAGAAGTARGEPGSPSPPFYSPGAGSGADRYLEGLRLVGSETWQTLCPERFLSFLFYFFFFFSLLESKRASGGELPRAGPGAGPLLPPAGLRFRAAPSPSPEPRPLSAPPRQQERGSAGLTGLPWRGHGRGWAPAPSPRTGRFLGAAAAGASGKGELP